MMQVPQFLLNDPHIGPSCSVLVTQPCRMSAILVAERVASERCKEVGWVRGVLRPSRGLLLLEDAALLRCRVRRPKYPSKSPLFLGSLTGYEPFLCFCVCWGCRDPRTALPLAWRLNNSYCNTQWGGDGSPFTRMKNPYKLSHTSRLMVYFFTVPYSSTDGKWESFEMRSNGCTMRHPPTN